MSWDAQLRLLKYASGIDHTPQPIAVVKNAAPASQIVPKAKNAPMKKSPKVATNALTASKKKAAQKRVRTRKINEKSSH